ncbi:MAG TPA: hypothetical protein VJ508_18290, partial [Saprospiraceae bacterium]|nr:hypothetical protein [Saprospiraceae bacterium]
MKWILGWICLAVVLVSCDNELVVTDKWKDIPVVWGLLSKSDTAHYVRVEKAFLDPTTSAYDIARIPDSLYYENAVVSLKRISSGQLYNLTRVDGDLEGYPREGGIFADTPNYLYKIKESQINLVVGEKYQLIVQRDDHSDPVTATTIILRKPVVTIPNTAALISFKSKANTRFKWNVIDSAGIYDLHLLFHYSERSPATGNLYVPKSFDWVVVRNLEENEKSVDGSEFYNTVKANIDEDINATRL